MFCFQSKVFDDFDITIGFFQCTEGDGSDIPSYERLNATIWPRQSCQYQSHPSVYWKKFKYHPDVLISSVIVQYYVLDKCIGCLFMTENRISHRLSLCRLG